VRRVRQLAGASAIALLVGSSAGGLRATPAEAQPPALDLRGTHAADFPVVRVAVTTSPEQAPAGDLPGAFRVVEDGENRPVDVQPCAEALAVAIVVDNRVGPDPEELRGLRNAAAELALRLAGDAEVAVFGTAPVRPAEADPTSHPVAAIAALEPGAGGDPRAALERAVAKVSEPGSYPVVVWLGTGADEVGGALDVVDGTDTSLYAFTLGRTDPAPSADEVRRTGGLSVAGSAADLRQAARDVTGELARTYLLTFTAREGTGEMKVVLAGGGSSSEVAFGLGRAAPSARGSEAHGWLVAVAAVLVTADLVAVAAFTRQHRQRRSAKAITLSR